MEPAEYFEIGHDCLFAPIPFKGLTLRQNYLTTFSIGPSLSIDPVWEGIEDVHHGCSIERDDEILFRGLVFVDKDYSIVTSPHMGNPDRSAAVIKNSHLVKTFEK